MNDADAGLSAKPRVTIQRRLSDFGPSGGLLVGAGAATCCCCCLHWIGAAIGGPAGLVAAWQVTTRRDPDVRFEARQSVFSWMWIGIFGTPICLLVFASLFMGPNEFGAVPLWVLAFFPSLAFLPVGLSVLVGAWIANWQIRARHRGAPLQRTGAYRLAWRVAWMSFVFSTLLTGVGYLIMLLMWVVAE
jgi:hypothetical protein